MNELPHGTVTFLFTDIEGSTDLTRHFGARYGDVRAEHRRVVREAIGAHGGHEIDTQGDAFFVVFDRAGDAVAAAVAAQRALSDGPVRVRMGLHTAEPHLHDDGYVGVGVSRAARICAAAHGGQILVSNATAGILDDEDVPGVRVRDLGDYRLKDLTRPQRLFQVDVDGLRTDFPPLRASGMRPTGLATIVYCDVTGWTRTLQQLGDDGAAAAAAQFHHLALDAVARHDGVELEVVADTVMTAYEDARDALAAAVALRAVVERGDWIATDEPQTARIAVHSGRMGDARYRHVGAIALRVVSLCATADPGQVLVSHATEALLEGVSIAPFELRDLGDRTIKGFSRPARVYELVDPTTAR